MHDGDGAFLSVAAKLVMTRPGVQRSICGLAAIGLCCSGLASAGQSGLERGAERVHERNTELRRRWQKTSSIRHCEVSKLQGVSANAHLVITDQADRFVVRDPKRGVTHALRMNHGLQRLAALFDAAELVVPAIESITPFPIGSIPAQERVMVVEALPGAFRAGNLAPRAWRQAVAEDRRLLLATLDLIARHDDRKLSNLMLDEKGAVRLIDPDRAFFARCGGLRVHASAFFPGRLIGYQTPQRTAEELPPEIRSAVDVLAGAVDREVAGAFDLELDEALVPIAGARRIQRLGLTGAIMEYLGTVKLHASQ